MKIIEVDIATVIPYENNPRKNDAAVNFVATCIEIAVRHWKEDSNSS